MKRYDDIEQELHELDQSFKLNDLDKEQILTNINEQIDREQHTSIFNKKWIAFSMTVITIILFVLITPLLTQPGSNNGEMGNQPIVPNNITVTELPSYEFKLPTYLPFEPIKSTVSLQKVEFPLSEWEYKQRLEIFYFMNESDALVLTIEETFGYTFEIENSEEIISNDKSYHYTNNDIYQHLHWEDQELHYTLTSNFEGENINQDDLLQIANSFVPYAFETSPVTTVEELAYQFAEQYQIHGGVAAVHTTDDSFILLGRIGAEEFIAASVENGDKGYSLKNVKENISLVGHRNSGSVFELRSREKTYYLYVGIAPNQVSDYYFFSSQYIFFNLYETSDGMLGYHGEDQSIVDYVEEIIPPADDFTTEHMDTVDVDTVKKELKPGMSSQEVLSIMKASEPSKVIEEPGNTIVYRFDESVNPNYTIEEDYVDTTGLLNGDIGMQVFVRFNERDEAIAISSLYFNDGDQRIYHYHLTEDTARPEFAQMREVYIPKNDEERQMLFVGEYVFDVPSQDHLDKYYEPYDKNQFISIQELDEQVYDSVFNDRRNVFANYRARDSILFETEVHEVNYYEEDNITTFGITYEGQVEETVSFKGDLRDRFEEGDTLRLKFDLIPISADGLYVLFDYEMGDEYPNIDDFLIN